MNHDREDPNHPEDTHPAMLRWALLGLVAWAALGYGVYNLFFGG